MLVMCTLSKGCLDIGSVPFGKHERVLLAFSVLLMTLLFPSPAHVVQGVLLGMLLLASRCLLVIQPGFPSWLLPRVVTFLTRSSAGLG